MNRNQLKANLSWLILNLVPEDHKLKTVHAIMSEFDAMDAIIAEQIKEIAEHEREIARLRQQRTAPRVYRPDGILVFQYSGNEWRDMIHEVVVDDAHVQFCMERFKYRLKV